MTITEYNKTVDLYADSLYRFLAKSGNDRDQAKDWVQETFLVLWNNVRNVEFQTSKNYLYTVGYRKMIDHFRSSKRNSTFEITELPLITESDSTAEIQEVLDAALRVIPEIQRTVIVMRDYEGYSYKEIGEITGLNESQVKVYIFRARTSLKEYLMNNDKVYPNSNK